MREDSVERLSRVTREMGASFVGVADLTLPGVHEHLVEQSGQEGLRDYPRALSIGIAQAGDIVDVLPVVLERRDGALAQLYDSHMYGVIIPWLDSIALRVASLLQGDGHRALPALARLSAGRLKRSGFISHKLTAHLAGLGWIGKSCLLVTPERGPRAIWTSVLTNAPLSAGVPMAVRCGSCRECVDACPAEAFTGRNFVEGEPREARMDADRCAGYRDGLQQQFGWRTCGLCLHACPYGRADRMRRS